MADSNRGLPAQGVEFGIADRADAHHALREGLFKLIQPRFVVSDTGECDGQDSKPLP